MPKWREGRRCARGFDLSEIVGGPLAVVGAAKVSFRNSHEIAYSGDNEQDVNRASELIVGQALVKGKTERRT
jgi:hypothetical protein